MLSVNILLSLMTFIPSANTHDLQPQLKVFADARLKEFDLIPEPRKRVLTKLALWTKTQLKSDQTPKLVFICTHNSRRSHISQLWAEVGAKIFNLSTKVETFSGGTEATAFNPRAVAALKRAGFSITQKTQGSNPIYLAQIGSGEEVIEAFSKVYDQTPNPKSKFAAIMTCSDADKNCPSVSGAAFRIAIPYKDPKAFDNTPKEAQAYDERVVQISREILFMFSQVKS